MRPESRDVLVVVDVQNDFCPGGALAVPGGDQVVPVINALAGLFEHTVLTQDWHPAGHRSFASAHDGRSPGDTIALPYGQQILWPDHCVQATPGAELHAGIDVNADLILRKGTDREIDSYSAFFENDRKTPTGLGGYVKERGYRRIWLCGLATDFCVRHTALDARKLGLDVVVVESGCRGIDLSGSLDAARRAMSEAGVDLVREVRT